MNNLTDLIDRYIAMWNETDSERRREIIARVWTRNASYVDPVLQGEGPAEIDAMVEIGAGALSRAQVPPHQCGRRASRPRPLRLGTRPRRRRSRGDRHQFRPRPRRRPPPADHRLLR